MDYYMNIANQLAKNINEFITFVYTKWDHKSSIIINTDKWYQVKLFVEEYKLQVIADELERINRFCWNESYTTLLVEDLKKALAVITEFVERNYDELFILTARLHTLKNLSLVF